MIDRDDPRVTAFALGELEEAQLEAELGPAALEDVAELREAHVEIGERIRVREAEFAAEPQLSLTPDQRQAVLAVAAVGGRRAWPIWAAAAGVGLLLYGGLQWLPGSGDEKTLAQGLETVTTSQSLFREGDTEADAGWNYRELSEVDRVDGALGQGGQQGHRFEAPPLQPNVHGLPGEANTTTTTAGSDGKNPPEFVPQTTTASTRKPPEVANKTDGTGATPGYPGPTLGLDLRPVHGSDPTANGTEADSKTGFGRQVPAGGAPNTGTPAGTTTATPDVHWGLLPGTSGGALAGEELAGLDDERARRFVESYATKLEGKDAEVELATLSRAIELDPAFVQGYANRGLLLLKLGDAEAAVADFERALKSLPNSGDAQFKQAWFEAREAGPEALGVFFYREYGHAHSAGPVENPFVSAEAQPRSTFSVDVDTASYALMRRSLTQNHALPAPDAVRIEEWINYFDYDYAPPSGEHPFAAHVEVAGCPWNAATRLVRIGLKGYEAPAAERPASNLVFLLDVSGSMSSENKLPLLKKALRMLVQQLRPQDRVAIVVYAGASGLVLESTPGDQREEILGAIERLGAGGSTNGGAGIELAYSVASQHYIEGGVNRVILATDGDFNVGVTERSQLLELIERKARSKVFLSLLGLGMRDPADATMEQLADRGNGSYSYLDTLREAHKVLVTEASGTLFTIAKDVKLQLEFNPARVASYRLIGYENRVLANRDFNDDTKDAGEIGAGHTVTALYEVVPTASEAGTDPLRYPPQQPAGVHTDELLFLKLRYKQPEGDVSKLMELPVVDSGKGFAQASQDFRFAAAVAAYGMILRNSAHKGTATLAQVEAIAQENPGLDRHGYRAEFVELVTRARKLAGR